MDNDSFKPFTSKKQRYIGWAGIKVEKANLYISAKLMHEMNDPASIDIYFDREQGAIAIKPGTSRKIYQGRAVYAKLPLLEGAYKYHERRPEGWVCLRER